MNKFQYILENYPFQELECDIDSHTVRWQDKVIIDSEGTVWLKDSKDWMEFCKAPSFPEPIEEPDSFFMHYKRLRGAVENSIPDRSKKTVFPAKKLIEFSLGDRIAGQPRGLAVTRLNLFLVLIYHSGLRIEAEGKFYLKVPDSNYIVYTNWIQ